MISELRRRGSIGAVIALGSNTADGAPRGSRVISFMETVRGLRAHTDWRTQGARSMISPDCAGARFNLFAQPDCDSFWNANKKER